MTGGRPARALGKGKIPTLSLRSWTRERICEFSVLETSCIAVFPSKKASTPSCASSPPKLCVKYPRLAQFCSVAAAWRKTGLLKEKDGLRRSAGSRDDGGTLAL